MGRTRTKERTKQTVIDGLKPLQADIEPISGNDIEYYKNRVYDVLEEYKQENDIDSFDNMKQLKWNHVLLTIGNRVFKLNGKNILDYRNYNLLMDLCNLYIHICFECSKSVSIIGFSYFISIDSVTIYKWINNDSRNTMYYDIDNNTIIDSTSITLYKVSHPNCRIEEMLNNAYMNIGKKIKQTREENLKAKTEDGSIPSLALGKIEYGWIEGKDKQLQAKLIESYIAPSNLLDKYE